MRIVFTSMFRESMGGGVGRVAYEIAPAFAKKHQVLFIKPGLVNQLSQTENLWILEIKSDGKGEVVIPRLGPKNIRFIFKTLKKFNPDIVHGQDPGPVSFLAQIWAKKKKIPFMYTSHVLPTKTSDFAAKEYLKRFGKIFDSKLVKKYFVNFFKNCDGIIALNERVKKDILRYGFKGKIFLIPNGRDLKLFRGTKKNQTLKNELLFVGYLTQRKNQKYLIEVMRYLPDDYTLKLVGPYLDEKYLAELKNLVRTYKLENVYFLGKLPFEKIPPLLLEAKVFVSSSKMEVQSLAVIEALSSGTPVVGLSNETVDEFVDDSCGYNLPKTSSAKQFAQKVKEICLLPEKEYIKLSENARSKTIELDWEKVVEKTIIAYKEVKTFYQNIPRENHINNWFWKSNEEIIREKNSKLFFKNFDSKDFSIIFLVIATFLGNYFYSLLEKTNNFLDKLKD